MASPTASRPGRVILVAFGPPELTRDSLRRARRLVRDGGDVTVVAAHRGAAIDATTPIGAAALHTVLAGDDVPVLLLHDDVLIGRDGVAAMMRAWEATGHPIVPWSNLPGTDHHVAENVPTDDDARMRLTRRLTLRGGRVATARPVCLLAGSARLRELCERFVTVADTVWSDPTVPVTAASKALAYHGDRCGAATAVPGSLGRPLLVASMIVRNEAEQLADCLASLERLVDRIEICDTGSTDATVSIAESFGAHVLHRPWRNDFAWARNEVLDRCRDAAYVLQIDADERARCSDPQALRRRLALLFDSVRVFSVPIDNLDGRGHIASSHDGPRVIRTDDVTYRGALHERPWSTDGDTLLSLELTGLRLEHHGYTERVITAQHKSDRNLAISRRAYEESPDWETAFHYARSISLGAEVDDALVADLLHETLRAGDEAPATWRAWALARLGRDALQTDDEQRALEFAQQALQLVPADPVAGAVLAEAAQRLGRSDLILDQRNTRRSTVSPKPFSRLAHARSRLAGAEIAALLELGATDEAFDEAAAAYHADPGHFAAWPALVRSVAGAADADAVDGLLVAAALTDATGGCITAITGELPSARAARICARYVEQGGADPNAVRNGLVTAIVAGEAALVDQFLTDAHRLEPAVLAHLASTLEQRGMLPQADDLRALAALPRRTFAVCGAGRSGLGYTSRALTALGHPCGHEITFDPFGHSPEFGARQGDASWLALPYLDDLPHNAVIFHQVRDPLAVVRSLVGNHTLTAPSPYLDFVAEHAPEVLEEPDEVVRAMTYWVVWNRRLAAYADGARPYVRYRVEDLTPEAFAELAGLLGSVQSPDAVRQRLAHVAAGAAAVSRQDTSITVASLPGGPATEALLALADEFGYALPVTAADHPTAPVGPTA